MKPVLLLIDLQNDFLQPRGLEPPPAMVIAGAASLLETFRHAGWPVIHVATTVRRAEDNRMPHWKRRDHWACVEGTPGHAFPPPLQPRDDEPVIHKTFFSAFSTGALAPLLRELRAEPLVIAGVHTHGCVRATILDAYTEGYRILVAADAIGSNAPAHAEISRSWLEERCAEFLPARELQAQLHVPA